MSTITTQLEPITRLSRDLAAASATLGRNEARFLVDAYYMVQEYRKATDNQVRSLATSNEPHAVIAWFLSQSEGLEGQIKRALDKWTDEQPIGKWAKSITGIGPVISAGLLAHIDITKAPTVGHIWSFAGLNPTTVWGKGEKRPWNTPLKTLCWKIGESFVKVSGHEKDIYGKVYLARKAEEIARNESGALADQAAAKLATTKIGKNTEAFAHYSEGKLPPAHLHARAKRYAVKLFLSHWHHAAYLAEYGVDPPKPYIIEHGGHVHFVQPPNLHVLGGVQ